MKPVSSLNATQFKKTMLKGGLAAASPGLAALVAAFTAPVSFLNQYTGMGSMGVAALGVLFFLAAYFLFRGYWWASIPAFVFTGTVLWIFSYKAARLLQLYYTHNPVTTITDIIAPFPVISLQLVLVFIFSTLGMVVFKAARLGRGLSPRPVNKFVWGATGLWGVVAVLDCMNKFQY